MAITAYLHVNQFDGKCYVGQTEWPHQRNIFHRTNKNRSFSKAIQSTGWDNFDHYYWLLESREKAENLEKLWIILLQSVRPENGYNRRFGGNKGSLPENVRAAIGESVSRVQTGVSRPHRGTPRPHLRTLIRTLHGQSSTWKRWSWPKGKPLSEEHKRKISEGRQRGLAKQGEI